MVNFFGCPICNAKDAYGDQCEQCGRTSNPRELINPRSALTGNAPVLKETTNWYLPLDSIQEEFLDDWVDNQKDRWKSNVYGQCKSWLNDGLKPRAMTRDLDWGVRVPIQNANNKVMYVWFDAPIGYITATKEVAGDQWTTWWKDSETEITHFLGKDNIVFHTIIFPGMLHAHGGFNLPTNVPANEFLNLEGNKISTSRNHAIWLHEYLKEFPDKADELRYVINSILPETKDADFTWKDYQAKVNNELVAILGNFVNRVIILTHKYFNGKIPDGNLDSLPDFSTKITAALDQFNQRQGLEAFMEIARYGNKYLQDTAPWKLIKDDDNQQNVADCILTCLHVVHQIGLFGQIFLPDTSHKILKNLNLKSYEDKITIGHNIGESKLLFEKVEDDVIEQQITKLNQKTPINTISQEQINQPLKPMIQYDDFVKLDIRVATITAAEKVKKTDRLLHITLDIGTEKREVVSGIAEHFAPEDIIGKQVTYLANLAPRTLKGIESNGMILMAENEDGSLRFVSPDEQTKPGSIIS